MKKIASLLVSSLLCFFLSAVFIVFFGAAVVSFSASEEKGLPEQRWQLDQGAPRTPGSETIEGSPYQIDHLITYGDYKNFLEQNAPFVEEYQLFCQEQMGDFLQPVLQGKEWHYQLNPALIDQPIPLSWEQAATFANWVEGCLQLLNGERTRLGSQEALLSSGAYERRKEKGESIFLYDERAKVKLIEEPLEESARPFPVAFFHIFMKALPIEEENGSAASYTTEKGTSNSLRDSSFAQGKAGATVAMNQEDGSKRMPVLRATPPQRSWYQRWFPSLSWAWGLWFHDCQKIASWWKEPGIFPKIESIIGLAGQAVATLVLCCFTPAVIACDIMWDIITAPYFMVKMGVQAMDPSL